MRISASIPHQPPEPPNLGPSQGEIIVQAERAAIIAMLYEMLDRALSNRTLAASDVPLAISMGRAQALMDMIGRISKGEHVRPAETTAP